MRPRRDRRLPTTVGRPFRAPEPVAVTIRSFDPVRLVLERGALVRIRHRLLDAPVTGSVARVRWIEDRPTA